MIIFHNVVFRIWTIQSDYLGSAVSHYYCSNIFRRNLKFGITIGHKIWTYCTNTWSRVQICILRKRPKHHQWWWQAHLWTWSDFLEEGRYWTGCNRICLWRIEQQVRHSRKKSNHPDKCLSYKGEKAEMTKLIKISSGLSYISSRQCCSSKDTRHKIWFCCYIKVCKLGKIAVF